MDYRINVILKLGYSKTLKIVTFKKFIKKALTAGTSIIMGLVSPY